MRAEVAIRGVGKGTSNRTAWKGALTGYSGSERIDRREVGRVTAG